MVASTVGSSVDLTEPNELLVVLHAIIPVTGWCVLGGVGHLQVHVGRNISEDQLCISIIWPMFTKIGVQQRGLSGFGGGIHKRIAMTFRVRAGLKVRPTWLKPRAQRP